MSGLVLGVAAVLMVVTGLIRAAGASLVRTPRADVLRAASDGDKRASAVARLLDDRSRLQPALGIFHIGLLVLVAILVTWTITRLYDGSRLAVALAVFGILLVAFGDLFPRFLGRKRPQTLAYRFVWLLRPVVALGDAAADLIVDLDEDDGQTDEGAAVEEAERALISQVLDFTDTIVREVMVPRTDMVTISSLASTDAALELVLAEGRSRIPVVGEGADDVRGILYARDLLFLVGGDSDSKVATEIMRPVSFVPETKRVSELLREMQASQTHLALVVDEFGGTAGLVTIEDLLEELVGEIVDEYDEEDPLVTPLDDGGYLLDARLSIDDLEDLVGIDLPADEWDTVGGLVLGLAGRVPREGEHFELDGHIFTCDRVQGRRIARVILQAR